MTAAATAIAPEFKPLDYVPGEGTWQEHMLQLAYRECSRAREKFPENDITLHALHEEVGELAKACLDEPGLKVFSEAIQVMAMAMRVAIDGDDSLVEWRKKRGLDDMRIEHCVGDPEPVPELGTEYKPASYQYLSSFAGADKSYWVSVGVTEWEKAKKAGVKTRILYERVTK